MDVLGVILVILAILFLILLAIFVFANLPTKWTLRSPPPTVAYFAEGKLRHTHSGRHVLTSPAVPASELFKEGPILLSVIRRPGCVFCRKEAAELSSLKADLDARGVRLVGVVHEQLGIEDFRPFFNGEIYYDEKKHFYGPRQRWLPHWMGFLRVGTYVNGYNAQKAGHKGNMVGEGRLLGGVYIIDRNEMPFAHMERSWGDAPKVDDVRRALQQLPSIQTNVV